MGETESGAGVPSRDLARWLRRYAVPTVIVAVALWQMVLVQTWGLSRWRGGGFGMYSDFHPHHTDVWVLPADGSTPVRLEPIGLGHACRTRANADCLLELSAERTRSGKPAAALEVWRLDLEPNTLVLTRRRIAALAASGEE